MTANGQCHHDACQPTDRRQRVRVALPHPGARRARHDARIGSEPSVLNSNSRAERPCAPAPLECGVIRRRTRNAARGVEQLCGNLYIAVIFIPGNSRLISCRYVVCEPLRRRQSGGGRAQTDPVLCTTRCILPTESDKPGIAPDCGMQLEPVYAEGGDVKDAALGGCDLASPGPCEVRPERQQLIGVKVATVGESSCEPDHPGSGAGRRPTRPASTGSTPPPMAGSGRFFPVTTGSLVKKDDLLADILCAGVLLGASRPISMA